MSENNSSNGSSNSRKKQRRRHRSEEERAKLVAEWKASGRSAPEFARERDVGESSLWKWAACLRRTKEHEAPALASPSLSSKFVAVEVKGRAAPERGGYPSPGRIEISLPGGAVVRLNGDVAPETVSTVMRILVQEWSC